MPRRLAITIAGAVSLGSYESGVLYEVLDAIDQHNRSIGDPSDDNYIVIDVLTGASAGGMTATILTQKLLYNADEFKGPYDNPLYNCWVKRIDLKGLLNTGPKEDPLHSIFSSDLINQISAETLLGRYQQNPVPAPQPHSAVNGSIKLGLALSNLNGVDYGQEVVPGGKFIYIKYADQLTRPVVSADADNEDFWTPLASAAVACGAFPFAFRTHELNRSAKTEASDYPGTNLEPWDADPQPYTYSDGGIFQNQPIGMAKNLVDLVDNHLHEESRYYLFISPNAKDATANDNFREANASYPTLLKRLFGAVFGQSEFHDWITAEQLNERIAKLDQRASQLAAIIQNNQIDITALQTTADTLLSLLFPDGSQQSPGAPHAETVDEAKTRIGLQYAAEMSSLGDNTDKAIAFRDSILAFESSAGLGAHETMEIYGVTATDSELAGAGLQAFLGFFDQDYRDHDYDVGRAHARDFFQKGADAKPNGICPFLLATPQSQPVNPINHKLDGLKLADVKPEDIKTFKDGLTNRLNSALKELIGGWTFLANPAADKLLGVVLDHLVNKT
jgi:predicted acylesterase/phospholipase RssA